MLEDSSVMLLKENKIDSTTNKAICVLVLGMHRSGTSAITRVLSFLGCDLPQNILGASISNELGHWESISLNRLNDRILESAGSHWQDWDELNKGWIHSPKAMNFQEEAINLLQDEFMGSKLFVLKDPRICKLMPFWLNVLDKMDIRPLIVFCHRNPLEVAASLQKRNGLEPAFGHLLWLRYILGAEQASRKLPRFFINYDQLLQKWGRLINIGQATLGIHWPRFSDKVAGEIEAFLSQNHRHHHETSDTVIENPSLSVWLRNSFEILEQWASSGENAKDYPILDRIRNAFNEAGPAFSRLIASGKKSASILMRTKEEFTETQKKLNRIEEKTHEQEKLLKTLETEKQTLLDELTEKSNDITLVKTENSNLYQQIKVLKDQVDRFKTDNNRCLHQINELQNQIDGFKTEKITNYKQLIAQKAQISILQNELDTIEEARQKAHRELADCTIENEALKENNHDLQEQLVIAKDEREKLNQKNDEINQLITAQIEQIKNLSSDKTSIAIEKKKLEDELNSQKKELEYFKTIVCKREKELYQNNKELMFEKLQSLSMVNTLSWRMTKPIRFLAKWVPKRKRKSASCPDFKAKIRLIRQSEYFDSGWYLAQYEDVARKKIDPARHYLLYGAAEGRNPGPEFNTNSYCETHLIAASSEVNPLIHHALLGKKSAYTGASSLKNSSTPSLHQKKKRSFIPFFKKPKVKRAQKIGKLDKFKEIIQQSDLFNIEWYLEQYQDVAQNKLDPITHYLCHGAQEGRDPGPKFNTKEYLKKNRDVSESRMNPLVHYLLFGNMEGRAIVASELRTDEKITDTKRFAPPEKALTPVTFPIAQHQKVNWKQPDDLQSDGNSLTIQFEEIIIGTIACGTPEENMSQIVARLVDSITVFCEMHGYDIQESLHFYKNLQRYYKEDFFVSKTGALSYRIITSVCSQTILADIAFINDYTLRLRFDSIYQQHVIPKVIRFYQYETGKDKSLRKLAETPLTDHGPLFFDVPLINPFCPVLVTVTSTEGSLLETSLIPFPSLSRGGMHYGELCASDIQANYPGNLHTVSTQLLDEWLGIPDNPHQNWALGRIEIELQSGSTGAEPIFSTHLRLWLAAVMRIKLAVHPCQSNLPPKVHSYLEKLLGTPEELLNNHVIEQISNRENHGLACLILPSDCIPSLHALVTRRLQITNTTGTAKSFVMSNRYTLNPEWKINMPAIGHELLDLHAVGTHCYFPIVFPLSNVAISANSEGMLTPPYAVKFHDTEPRHESDFILPLPIDSKKPFFHRVKHDSLQLAEAITVVIPACGNNLLALGALLESLQWQTIAEKIEIIAITDLPFEPIKRKLESFFPGKANLMKNKKELSEPEQIHLATQSTSNGYLLIAHEEILLHDPRTVETLCQIAAGDQIASAGCLLICDSQEKASNLPVKTYSGGLFPFYSSSGQFTFSEFDCHDIFPFNTYPVAVNSPLLFMVRKDIWDKVGGYDIKDNADCDSHFDYGIRSIKQGYLHFCTSIISAGFGGSNVNRIKSSPTPMAMYENSMIKTTTILEAIKG
ncbi:TPA: hypothetical protein OUZ75_000413 [Legionella pneumophila]|nr:hypothetical protein [Legionella pneumophila]